MKNIAKISFLTILGAPFMAFAATSIGGSDLLNQAITLLTLVPKILIAFVIIFIIWKGIQYASAKDEAARKEGLKGMIGGIIALAVAFSIFGIVTILQNTVFGGQANQAGQGSTGAPCLPGITIGC